MDQDKILLWAEAKRLNIPDYRKVSEAELRKMIATAKKGGTPGKGKPAASATKPTNGTRGKAAATTAVRGKAAGTKGKAAPAKGKATVPAKRAPAAKSTVRKATPAKGKASAAQGKATRPATGGRGETMAPKTVAAKPRAARGKSVESYVSKIDNKAVNWKAPWTGGTTGKRGTVMASLRSNKGDKAKVFAEVKRFAVKWYPDKDKNAADRMVVWLIGRVALDFVKATGQHESGQRAAYGTSTKVNDVRRREAREAARPKARTRRAPAKAKATATRGKAPTRKPAAGRTTAPKGKTTTARGKAPATRKPAATRGKATAAKGKGRR